MSKETNAFVKNIDQELLMKLLTSLVNEQKISGNTTPTETVNNPEKSNKEAKEG